MWQQWQQIGENAKIDTKMWIFIARFQQNYRLSTLYFSLFSAKVPLIN
jgi:hypothetical protein